MSSLPVRAYLDQTVVPLLLQGMAMLAKEVRARLPLRQQRQPAAAVYLVRRPLTPAPFSRPPAPQRPANPVEYLGLFLLKNDPAKQGVA